MLRNTYRIIPLPTSCSLLVTEQCNLRCKYCFETHNNNFMTEEVAKIAVEFLFENSIKNGMNEDVNVCFFGGEPTLNPKAIMATIERGLELSEELQIGFGCSMITNCVTLPDELAEYLKIIRRKIHLDVQLSIDGIKKVQDRYRVTPNGKGSYDIVIKTVEKWKEVFTNDDGQLDRSLHIHGCLNRDSLPYMYESFKHFTDDLGIHATWFLPIAEEEWVEDDVQIYREQTKLIVDDILTKVKENQDKMEIYYHAPFNKFEQCTHSNKLCGAGINYCSITSKGLVYPCHQYYFNDPHKETCIGDIFDKEINEHIRRFFAEYEPSDLTCKKDCENVTCYRCIASNFTNNKSSIAQTRKFYCQFMSIDRENHSRIEEELYNMGLISAKMTEHGRCAHHTVDISNGCDIVKDNNGHVCECDGGCNNVNVDDNKTLEAILETLIVLGRTVEDTNKRLLELEKKGM